MRNLKWIGEYIIKKLKKHNKLVPNENGVYIWNKFGTKETPITATTEAEFVDKVLKYEQSLPAKRLRATADVKRFLKEGIKNGLIMLTAKSKVRLLPPLVITYEEIDQAIDILKNILKKQVEK